MGWEYLDSHFVRVGKLEYMGRATTAILQHLEWESIGRPLTAPSITHVERAALHGVGVVVVVVVVVLVVVRSEKFDRRFKSVKIGRI